MSEYAYWLTPKGELIRPESRHILTIVNNPKQFGETEKSINDTFDKYGEQSKSNLEGQAREDIILRVINRGFARIRKGVSRRNQSWSIQIKRFNAKMRDTLWVWANQVTSDGTASDKFADVVIHQLGKGDKMTRTSLDQIASGVEIKEHRKDFKGVKVYSEDEVKNLQEWSEYARFISPDQLSESAKIEVLAHIIGE